MGIWDDVLALFLETGGCQFPGSKGKVVGFRRFLNKKRLA